MKKFLFCLAVAAFVLLPDVAAAQRRRGRGAGAARSVRARSGLTRTLRGRLRGNVITARTSDDRPGFDYAITAARVRDGRLEIEGTVAPAGARARATAPATATLVGTLAKNRPADRPYAALQQQAAPVPSAAGQTPAQPQGTSPANPETAGQLGQLAQATQDTARTTQTPTAPGGRQPASTTVTDPVTEARATGCELMFFKMQLPAPLRAAAPARADAVQLGVMVPSLDNKRGEEINQRMCRIVRALDSGGYGAEVEAELAQLNRLLGQGR